MELTYYTRKRCQLCEDGKLMLELLQNEYSFTINEKDIDESDQLTERFGLMIPVVEIEGQIVQYGLIDLVTIEEHIRKTMKIK